jgi:diguanylate cyclase (GGDEF)-like protein
MAKNNNNTFTALNLSTDETAFISAHPIITVANEMDWPPFDYNEFGKPRGLSIEYIKLLANKAGLEIKFINGYTWDELLKQFENKQIDVIPAIYRNKKRESFTLYSNPYYRGKLGVFTHDKAVLIEHIEKLIGKRVGIQKAHGAIPILQKKIPGIQFIENSSTESLVKMLATDKLDAIIGNPLLFSYFAKENQISSLKLIHYIDMDKEEQLKTSLHVGVRNDYPLLHQILLKAMETVTDDEMNHIENKWQHFQNNQIKTISLTRKERLYLEKKGEILFCVDPDWMPYEGLNDKGQHSGMSADFAKLLSRRLGIKTKIYRTKNWSDTLLSARQRNCDLSWLANSTPSRNAYMNFTRPFITFPYILVTDKEQFFIDDFEQYLDKTYAVVQDYAVVEELRQRYPNINLIEVKNILSGLEMVRNNSVFAYIGATAVVSHNLRLNGIFDIKIAGKLPWSYEMSIATRNDEPLLGSIMQKAVDSIKPQEKKHIQNKWIAMDVKHITDLTMLWQILSVAVLILTIVLYWNRKLSVSNLKLEAAQKQLKKQYKQLEELSITDRLTGLYNRVRLDEVLKNEILRAQRYPYSFAIIIIDIDYFKQVNDTYGHNTGDVVLVEIAQLIVKNVRAVDTAGRWGGEEFLIICPEAELSGALTSASSLRNTIEKYQLPTVVQKTVSFGVTVYQKGDSHETLIDRADKALYKAKAGGRNRVEFQG